MNPISNSIPQLDRHPDLHLDAEVLNAFAEQALAAHEREQVLAHMAVCGHCREVVFLAQELAGELVESAVSTQQPIRLTPESKPLNSWLKTWRFVWISAAACAAVVAAVAVLHLHEERTRAKAERLEVVGEAVAAKPAVDKESGVARSSSRAVPMLASQSDPTEASVPVPSAPAVAGASPSERAPAKSEALAASATEIAPREPEANDDSIEVAEVTENPARLALETKAQAVPSIEPMSHLAGQESDVPSARRSSTLLKRFMSAGSAPRTSTAARTGMAALHAGELYDENVITARNAMLTRLPNGKMPISTVSWRNHLLAVDSAGSVFLSESQGYVWEPVATQWTDRAVEVRLKQAPDPGLAAFARTEKSKSVPEPTFELITDRSDIWTSSDGKNWKRE